MGPPARLGTPPDRATHCPTHPGRPARLLLIEDHPLLAQSLRHCLLAEGYAVEVASLESPATVLADASRLLPDVVLLDIDLGEPIGDGAMLVRPLMELGATVLVVSGTTQPSRVGACLQLGAAGFVPKSRSLEQLVAAVADAVAKRPLLSDEDRSWFRSELDAARTRNAGLERLTPREAAILRGLIDGLPVAVIAERTFVVERTVRSQVHSILAKLGVNSQLAAVAIARKAGWTTID